jgi:hypothetical protein
MKLLTNIFGNINERLFIAKTYAPESAWILGCRAGDF